MLLTALTLAQAAMAPGMPAGMPDPVCIRAGDLPRAFAGWNAAPGDTLTIGRPFVMTGVAPGAVGWAAPAGKPGDGAIARFTVAKAGTYRIGLGTGAWIDLVANGKVVASTAHGHGPACTGLRKIVDFRLSPGIYALQLSGMTAAETKVMVVRR